MSTRLVYPLITDEHIVASQSQQQEQMTTVGMGPEAFPSSIGIGRGGECREYIVLRFAGSI